MSLILETWGIFIGYVFVLGVFRIITDLVWRAFTRGDL